MNEKLLFGNMIAEACEKARLVAIINVAQKTEAARQSSFFDSLWNAAMTNFFEFSKKFLEAGIEILITEAEATEAARFWSASEKKVLFEILKTLAFLIEYEKTLRGED